jgi:hypothetical protein
MKRSHPPESPVAFVCFDELFLRRFIKAVKESPEIFQGTAYGRNLTVQVVATFKRSVALQHRDRKEADRVARLMDFWNRADKGKMARGKFRPYALGLIRELYVHQKFPKKFPRAEADLSTVLLTALGASPGNEFELALAEAKRFRAKRRGRLTEDSNLRADLTFIGVMGQLFGRTFPDSDYLMQMYNPSLSSEIITLKNSTKELDKINVENLERNWRRLLDQCHVTPRKQRKRGPRNLGTG